MVSQVSLSGCFCFRSLVVSLLQETQMEGQLLTRLDHAVSTLVLYSLYDGGPTQFYDTSLCTQRDCEI